MTITDIETARARKLEEQAACAESGHPSFRVVDNVEKCVRCALTVYVTT